MIFTLVEVLELRDGYPGNLPGYWCRSGNRSENHTTAAKKINERRPAKNINGTRVHRVHPIVAGRDHMETDTQSSTSARSSYPAAA